MTYIIITITILLVIFHNILISKIEHFNQPLSADFKVKEKIIVSLVLFLSILLFIIFSTTEYSQLLNTHGLTTIVVSLISSAFTIYFLQSLLQEMSSKKLFFKFLITPSLLSTVFFIITINLLILFWLQEMEIDVQKQFLSFIIGYGILIIVGSIFIENPKPQRDGWYLTSIAIINPIIVVLISWILFEVVLNIILKLFAN